MNIDRKKTLIAAGGIAAAARPDPRGAAHGTRQIDVGMDPWDLKPVSLDTLVALVEVLEGVSAPTVLRS